MLRALVYDTSIGGVMVRQGRASNQRFVLYLVTSSVGLLYLKRVALRCLTLIHSWKLECLDSSCSSTSAFYLDDELVGPTRLARKASQLSLLVLGIQL